MADAQVAESHVYPAEEVWTACGHPRTPENTKPAVDRRAGVRCRECANIYSRRHRHTDEYRAKNRAVHKRRRATNPIYRIKSNMRSTRHKRRAAIKAYEQEVAHAPRT